MLHDIALYKFNIHIHNKKRTVSKMTE